MSTILRRSPNAPASEVAPWLPPIEAAMDEFQIDSAARQAAFLAQIVHEVRMGWGAWWRT